MDHYRFPVTTSSGPEHELKFHVAASSFCAVRQWADRVFQPNATHPESTICSVYFDTADHRSYREKEASEHEKTKYRVRWYADAEGNATNAPAYLELKRRHGALRRKYRVPLPVPARELAAAPLTDALFVDLFRRWHHGDVAPVDLSIRPLLELRYRRRRYTHAVFGETLCLDTAIQCVRTHPGTLPPADGKALGCSIFEQKGLSADPLPPLRALPRFGARRAALSKYFLAIRHLVPEHNPQ